MRATAISFACSIVIGAAAMAQSESASVPFPEQFGPVVSVTESTGLDFVDSGLQGRGADYKIDFGADRVEFTPALGSAAPHNMPVALQFTSVARRAGETTTATALGDVRRAQHGMSVHYTRGTVTEVYDLLPRGVEQSFVFSTLPDGAGELVVRLKITTELPAQSTPNGIVFLQDGIGGVSIEKVVGIDAIGRRVDGAMHVDGDVLELTLPGDFVESAVLPLVLDPLLGTVRDARADASEYDDIEPDVAYNAAENLYLVVFARRFSLSNVEIHGQRIHGTTGALAGGNVAITSSSVSAIHPSVANVKLENEFVVVWEAAGDILGRTVDAHWIRSNGPITTLVSGSDLQIYPDIGGESTNADNDAVLTWWNLTDRTIEARQVEVRSDDTLFVWSQVVTLTPVGVEERLPAISKSGGTSGHHLIVRERGGTVFGTIVTRNLGIIGQVAFPSTILDRERPDVDGDGERWVVAYQTEESDGNPNDDIRACNVVLNSNARITVGAETLVDSNSSDDEQHACVAFFGQSAVIPAPDAAGARYDMYLSHVDAFQCTTCEGRYIVDSTAANKDNPAIATQRSGDASFDSQEALLVWQSESGGDSDVLTQRFGARSGAATDLGGGCGRGGRAFATCAHVPNSNFTSRLTDAEPGGLGYLIIGLEELNATCGPCRLVPNLFTSFFGIASINPAGTATITLPLPDVTALRGVSFIEQWLTPNAATPLCSQLTTNMSNAIRVVIH